MRYVNKKTGAVIDSSRTLSGGDWMSDEEIKKVEHVESTKDKSSETEDTEKGIKEDKEVKDEGDISKKDIMTELDALGIQYKPTMSKSQLYNLMTGGKDDE